MSTNWGQSGSGLWRFALAVARPFMLSATKGARASIHVASAPELEGVSGRYFKSSKETRSSKRSRDVEAQKRLWEVSAKLTGVTS